ncbi:MAG TPA: dienelactone hydrolase family protein, partial [Blastocatellia bacterium]|nr:dienelactone hydrolase family protein [Blastocatellia bacterium]
MPAVATPEHTVPAALLLHAAGHDRDAFASFVYPGIAQILASQGVAALSIDWRGRGKSIGNLEYHSFTDEQRAKIHLDVRAALSFLASLPEIDGDRMAVLAEEASADWAVLGADGDPRVKALAFISGRFGERARSRLAAREHTPVLCVVSKEDRRGFADMSALFAGSKSDESDFRLYEDMGIGTTMFALWRYRYPDERGVGFLAKQGVDTEKIGLVPKDPGDEKPIEDVICDWIVARLKSLGRMREVSFQTSDGWTIYGNLLTPEKEERVPGVVMVHSGLSDRYIFHGLERLFVKNGVAVLNIDWRGRGKSRDRGDFLTLPREERDRAHLDVKAAVDLLAGRPEVDAQRIAIIGTYIGAKYAAAAALGDPRIGALVMLSGYIPSGKEREEIAGVTFPILFIGSRGFGAVTNAMADLYELTRDRGSELILYDGGALGYQLFEVDETLERRIVDWVKGRLIINIRMKPQMNTDEHR